jgi:hypothetical protein
MREELEKSEKQLAQLLASGKAALKALAEGNGTYWKEVVGGPQPLNNEFPIWILLYEDCDLLETHKALCETLRPYMTALAPLQLLVLYRMIIENSFSAAQLSGNDAVFSASTNGKIDLKWSTVDSRFTRMFASSDSKRPV